ncbi:FAD binding domain-containing protein [Sporomusa acidovorans]|uniref:Nicotinate dehydrogenase FAD-subunit n=1 Tax=Sporomusa acidovorans (strain ATCC 49682 / DSM 3132 / Mol) TaxID=1123286 RepID=A0ABZ3J9W7_SPOA4|nr:FAD binding domain-containing protein [Sporomusa acidovorans]OZC16072.1 nicotinate dehydrogenase FAD-subunit [Sporomusa acidovorans DSM 3132]SDD87632.1 carbon-monoxide dehydrogenase medium subunit [Sporomusa acidovorans]
MAGYKIAGFLELKDVLQEVRHTCAKIAFISGGTDFINNNEGKNAELVIDLSQVADLKYIKDLGTEIRIGGGTTFACLAASPVIKAKVSALAQAAGRVGSVQIRNRATIGGNIASGSPAGDSLPVLAALDASIQVDGINGPRKLSLAETLLGLQEKEIITEIVIPTSPERRSAFVKIGSRSQVTIAKLSLAASITYNSSKRLIVAGKAAMGAIGKIPVCPLALQQFFSQRVVDESFADDLAQLLIQTVDEMIAGRASHPYKRSAVKGLAYDLTAVLFDVCKQN